MTSSRGFNPHDWNKLLDMVEKLDERVTELEPKVKALMKYVRALVQEKLGNEPFEAEEEND